MKRFIYIIVLSALAVVIITVIQMITREKELPPSKEFILPVIPDSPVDLPPSLEKKPYILGGEFPRYELIEDKQGNEIRVQTGHLSIGKLTPAGAKKFEGEEISFVFYDKSRHEKPLEERIIAKGTSDRAEFYSPAPVEGLDMRTEFKPDFFVLKDNIKINAFDPRTGKQSFSVRTNDLICRKSRFDSTERITISREGIVVAGDGMELDLESSEFVLQKNIRIEAENLELSDLSGFREDAAPEKKKEKEAKGRESSSPIYISAAGPLLLKMPGKLGSASSNNGSSGRDDDGVEKSPSRLEIKNDVVVTREKQSFSCDVLVAEFIESSQGEIEIKEMHGASEANRTTLNGEGYTVYCDELTFRREKDKDVFILTGTPEIDNVSMPLFSSLSRDESLSLMKLDCGERIEIESFESEDASKDRFIVNMDGGVLMDEKENPGPHLLKADTVSFLVTKDEKKEGGSFTGKSNGDGTALLVKEFKANGNVTGHIQEFDLACSSFSYNYTEAADGYISSLVLSDPEESRLEGEQMTIRSAVINIELYPDVTEISANDTFVCTSEVEELPRIRSFSLFDTAAEETEEAEKTGEAEPMSGAGQASGGRVEINGCGEFRLLGIEDPAGPKQTLSIKNGDFHIRMLRGGIRVLDITGNKAFSLQVIDGALSSLEVRGDGNLDCPELGFSSEGDFLSLGNRDSGSMEFHTEADDCSASISFIDPGLPDPCTIHAGDIDVYTGDDVRLIARRKADAVIPAAMFERKKDGGDNSESGQSLMGEGGLETVYASADTIEIERPEGAEHIYVSGKGSSSVRSGEKGPRSTCTDFNYGSESEVLSLVGTAESPAQVSIPTALDPTILDSVTSTRVDMNLGDSTAFIDRGGTVVLNQYDQGSSTWSRISIDCVDEIRLRNDVLEFKGPVSLVHTSGAQEGKRTLDCDLLLVYFLQSPRLSKPSAMDYESYRAMIKNGGEPVPEEDGNMIKRIEAMDNVLLNIAMKSKSYSIDCNRLSWDFLKDEIQTDGLGEPVNIVIDGSTFIRGKTVIVRPVMEEIAIVSY